MFRNVTLKCLTEIGESQGYAGGIDGGCFYVLDQRCLNQWAAESV